MITERERAVVAAELRLQERHMYTRRAPGEGPVLLSHSEIAMCLLMSRRSTETLESIIQAYRDAMEEVEYIHGQVTAARKAERS